MRRLALALLALGLVLAPVVLAPPAYACSCTGISTERAFRQADAAFVGTVLRRDEAGSGDDRRLDIRFSVSRAFKGEVYAEQVVASTADREACGLDPRPGSSWVIFASDGVIGTGSAAVYRLRTTVCSGNLATSSPPALLGPGQPPQPGASDREERAVGTDARLTRGLVLAGIGGLALLALIGIGLAYLWRPRPPT